MYISKPLRELLSNNDEIYILTKKIHQSQPSGRRNANETV